MEAPVVPDLLLLDAGERGAREGVVGPEGGFTDYEVEKLHDQDCQPVHLGPRILRVETAIPALLSKLY